MTSKRKKQSKGNFVALAVVVALVVILIVIAKML